MRGELKTYYRSLLRSFVPFFDVIIPKKILTFRKLAYIIVKIFIIHMREDMAREIVGQIFGVLGAIITFFMYQVNKKRLLLVIQTTACACICLSYFFLGATSGFALNIICIIRNLVFCIEKESRVFNGVLVAVFVVALGIFGAVSWQGWLSLLIIVALMTNTVFTRFAAPQALRKSILLTSGLILIYNIFVFSIGGILNESIAIVSSVVGIIRFWQEEKKEEN